MARLSTLAVLAALASAAPESPSEQIHLSLTPERGSMAVSFVVRDWNCPTGTTRSVAWAVANDVEPVPTLSNTATVNGVSYSDSGETLCLFDGVLSGLPANTRVFYRPESATTTYSFVSDPQRPGGNTYALLADFGIENDISGAMKGAFDTVIFGGDYAYDFPEDQGSRGNDFMNMMEATAARAPWMGSVGNHESANGFSEWSHRFAYYTTLAKASGSDSQFFFSYNHGLVHFVHISTEHTPAEAWLEADLAAVDRKVTPWVIAVGHKEKWMDFGTEGGEFGPYDRLFRKYNVDLYVCGHEHSYQRVRPRDASDAPIACASADLATYTDCGAYATLVVGASGNREMTGLIGELDRIEHASASLMDVFTVNYGWSLMTVHNATTLSFVYQVTGNRDPEPVIGEWDAWTLVVTTH